MLFSSRVGKVDEEAARIPWVVADRDHIADADSSHHLGAVTGLSLNILANRRELETDAAPSASVRREPPAVDHLGLGRGATVSEHLAKPAPIKELTRTETARNEDYK